MKDKQMLEVDNVKFTVKDVMMITFSLANDDKRLESMPEKNLIYLGLVTIKDYIHDMNCVDGIKRSQLKSLKNPEERAFVAGIFCLYCELRYRATRGHNEELSKIYLREHDAILKQSVRTMKKKELEIFLGALTA